MTAFDPDSRDPGLAAERTDLAWDRSGLSMIACGAAIIRGFRRPALPAAHVAVGTCVLLLGGITWFLGAWHARRRRTRALRPTIAADLVPIAVGVALVGAAAFVLGVVSPG